MQAEQQSAWEMPSEPELFAFINRTPLLQSLLYDIDLLPEQIPDERRWNYMLAVCEHMRAALSHPSTPQGWQTVPVEPAPAMLDRAVAFALSVSLSSEYRWTEYMTDLWATMLAGSPPPPEQGGPNA